MAKRYVSNERITPQLFANPLMEKLSHVHPSVPLILYIPVITYCLYLAATRTDLGAGHIVLLFFVGIVAWTLAEYAIHRFVFHYEPKSRLGQRIHFLAHGVHHDYPRDPLRLVMPPVISIPLAIFFYVLFKAVLGITVTLPFYAGFVFGYLCYDMIHYATHHFSLKESKVALWLKQYHSLHHYQDERYAYGVSNPLWDYVFRTTPKVLHSKASKDTA